MKPRWHWILALWCAFLGTSVGAADEESGGYALRTDISYYDEATLARADDYQRERSKLDIYYPVGTRNFPTVIWFYGGGLTDGDRYFPEELKEQGIALVAPDYRLSPKAKLPSFIEDSAAATAWVLKHIKEFGGDPAKVFVMGHSAGAYLTMMVGMDPKWLAARGASIKQLAGLIPISGQTTTHFTVKQLQGDRGHELRPLIDEYAPLYHADDELPPICLIVGDRRIEWPSRVEESELLAATLRKLGHKRVEFYEMGGLDHDTVEFGGLHVARACIDAVLHPKRKGSDR
jgi:acetyl esterase/lipase